MPKSTAADISLVILDRDGIINEDSDEYIKSPDELNIISDVPQAIARLNYCGIKCVLVTNQSGIGRKLFTLEGFILMQHKINQTLAGHDARLDGVFFCPHAPDDNCSCRKPEPALILKAIKRFAVKPENVIFAGDSLRDIQAAHNAEVTPVLIRTGNGAKTEKSRHPDLKGVRIYDSLMDFVTDISKSSYPA